MNVYLSQNTKFQTFILVCSLKQLQKVKWFAIYNFLIRWHASCDKKKMEKNHKSKFSKKCANLHTKKWLD